MLIAWQRPCSDAVVDLLLWLLRGQREGRGGRRREKDEEDKRQDKYEEEEN